MSDEEIKQPWDQMKGESAKWFGRFDQFRLMKPWERSINVVFEREGAQKDEKERKKAPGAWYRAAKQYQWEGRAVAYDKWRRDQRDRRIVEKEADILDIEYVQKYERVKALDDKARLIEQSWCGPEDSENEGKIFYPWLTPDKVREWRGCLDDIAAETGGRTKTTKVAPTEDFVGAADRLFNKMAAFQQKKTDEQPKP